MKFYLPFFALVTLSCSQNSPSIQRDLSQPIQDSDQVLLQDSSITPIDSVDLTYSGDELEFIEEESTLRTKTDSTSAVHTKKYSQVLYEIQSKRSELSSLLESDTSKSDSIINITQSYLFNKLTVDVLPFWYGTPWDFNGISNEPKKGVIACGYFVSTPLKHIGFNLNRYRVAQKGATEIINTLAGKGGSKTYTDKTKLIVDIKKRPDGIYIIGLSCHVGFVEKRDGNVYFTHSNYLTPCEVIREDFNSSPAIEASGIYVLGDFSLSKKVILTWLNETPIKV